MNKRDRISKLDEFTKAFLVAALTCMTDTANGCILDDITHKALDVFEKDCREFQTENAALLTEYYKVQGEGQAGTDFWLTRNGDGAGFWDRDGIDSELGDKLSAAAEEFGPCSLSLWRGKAILEWHEARKPKDRL